MQCFDFVVILRCVVENFRTLERLEIKSNENDDCLSMYIINRRQWFHPVVSSPLLVYNWAAPFRAAQL